MSSEDEVALQKIGGFGVLSRTINYNVEYVTRVTVDVQYAQKKLVGGKPEGDGVSYEVQGDTRIAQGAKENKNMRIDGKVNAQEFVSTSDARVKDDVRPLRGCLSKVLQLQGFSYSRSDWEKIGVNKEERFIGLIAQSVAKVYPELVFDDPKTGLLSVNYDALIAVLIEAVKEMYALVRSKRVPVYGKKRSNGGSGSPTSSTSSSP